MGEMALSELEIQQLISVGETNQVELKVASPRPSEMAERLCGMANANGGVIIIGVEDTTLDIMGVPSERMALTKDVILRATRQVIKPSLILAPPEPEVCVVDGKCLVVATVPPNNGPIYQSGGVCWVRRSTHTVPLSVSEMMELANDRGLMRWELQPAYNATIEDIDREKVDAYLRIRSARSLSAGRFKDMEAVLVGLGCASVLGDGRIIPTNISILFFGHGPQWHIIQSEVVCVVYHDELGIGKYIDRKIIIGTLQDLIDGTEAFLNKYVAVGARIEQWKRIDLPEYPLEALREAVVNAVVHRDYSRVGENIRVFYYSDRIEIHSPGLLLPGIAIEQMERGEVTSKLRNPVLAGLLRDVPGYMERIGSGIKLMLNETGRMGLPAPEFRETSEFVVTFRKLPDSGNIKQDVLFPQDISLGEGKRNLEKHNLSTRESRFRIIMGYIQEHGSITSRQYYEIAAISERTASRDLEDLVARGALKSVGKTRGRIYKLP
jgi:ATP-dependent DNA helicase RecG